MSEQDPKAIEKCHIFENTMTAHEYERSGFCVKHTGGAEETSLQVGVGGAVCMCLVDPSKEPEMARSASLPRSACVDKVFAKGLGGATVFAGKGFGQNHLWFAPLSATGWLAALNARIRWWLHEKCATTM